MSPSTFLRYLLLPATSFTVLVFLAVLSCAFTLSLKGGLLGLPALVLFASWLFNYSFVLLEAIAHGASEPPVLAIEMLNPVHEWRPIFALGMLLLLATLLSVVAVYVDARLAIAAALLCFAALPASTASLAISSSAWQSVHPGVLWHVGRTLGLTYLAIVGVILLYGLVEWRLAGAWETQWSDVSWWPACAWGMFAWLSVFTLIGGSLYEHRLELGHEAIDSPERREARVQAEIERDRARFMDRLHGQARGGNLAGAWAAIEHELAEHQHSFETYDWLLDALSDGDHPLLARRLAQEYVARALGRDNARATLIAQRGLQIAADFRPRSGAQCLRLAQLLRLAGDRQSAQSLLRDFATHFPGDPAIADAESLLAALTRR